MNLLGILLLIALVPVAFACGYLLLLTLASAEVAAPPAKGRSLCFDLLVPSHNEEKGIVGTVQALQKIDWPRDQFRILVIADNCTDQTPALAREAGAEVWERQDEEKRGKGYALEMAFERSVHEKKADAVVVVDADTVVSPGLLAAFATRLSAGARAVQADYAVRNPNDSWRTRLMSIAFSMFHALRSNGRERLGLSCGLRGNGMCFTHELLVQVPHNAFSIVEDVEYGIRLGEAGVRIWYVGEAKVFGEMVAGEQGSRSQRTRWEGGRAQLAKLHGRRLLREGLARRDKILLDLAVDVLVPPLSVIALSAALGLVVSFSAVAMHQAPVWLGTLWFACVFAVVAYVFRGWSLSGTGLRGLLDLALAPLYMVWKTGLRLRPTEKAKAAEWVRTTRGNS